MKKLLMIAFLVISNVVCTGQESVVLKYNYKKGDKYVMQMSFKQNMGIAGGMNLSMKANINVVESSKETFKLANKIKKVSADVSQGGKTMHYDSDMKDSELDDEGKKMKAQFASALKAISYTTFNNRGKILSVKVEPKIPGANQASNQSLMTYSVFPKEAVKVGSTWTNEQDIQGMKLTIIYTVTKITAKSVETSLSGNINVMGVAGKITGDASFSRKTGNTDSMKMDTSISMQGMTMSMGTSATIKKVN
ncbi:hypothetical protein RQM59_11050 [Flavobacteriaceae bacterium S356]|uniref:DUF3108 domain-containing protein n=1 Tax=Asprobacillus argus TaxID=3076534 RepID=A0ABU3LGZ7_9FLAO|nr:hypothetical protein [Flavobacteriaceae bacterium S356]